MDVVTAASTLRDHMIVHDVAQRQTQFLDEHITTLSQQSLISHLDGNAARSLQLSLRLSTLEGVKHIYQQISQKKWNQIICIINELNPVVNEEHPAIEKYMNFLVETANKKMDEILRRIERFFDNLKLAVEEAKDDSTGDKTTARKSNLNSNRLKKKEGRINQAENNSGIDIRQDVDKYNDRDRTVSEIDISDCVGFLDEG